ncbi:MAG TPA: hypothetical protein VHA78_03200 [Candidatus Peribacteraceae bacterium]|nr:hypothetical protein [Candidatus Peribacteraceae bacterium]
MRLSYRRVPAFIGIIPLLILASCSQPYAQQPSAASSTQSSAQVTAQATSESESRCQQKQSAVEEAIKAYDVQKNTGHDPATWHETSKLDAVFYSPKTQSCLYTWTSTNYQKDHVYSTKTYLSDVKTNQLILQCFHISSDLDTCAQFHTDLLQYTR